MKPQLLFNSITSTDYISQTEKSIINEINRLQEDDFSKFDDEILTTQIFNRYRFQLPELNEADTSQRKPQETVITLRNDDYFSRGSRTIPSTKFTFVVPFKGNAEAFEIRPNSYTLNPPYGIIQNNELIVEYNVSQADPQKILNEFKSNIESIKRYLANLDNSLTPFFNSLTSFIKQKITTRRGKLNKALDTANSFGFPIKG